MKMINPKLIAWPQTLNRSVKGLKTTKGGNSFAAAHKPEAFMKTRFFAILSILTIIFAFAAPVLAQDTSWGPWASMGNDVSVRLSAPLMNGGVTWEFRNDGATTITYMDYYYYDKAGTHYDALPGSLRPGQILGGWAAFGPSSGTQVSFNIKTIQRAGSASSSGGSADTSQQNLNNQQSSIQSALQQQLQAQQQAAQQRQQQLQQQQAELQQQIAEKKAALQAQQQALEEKRQQIINDANAKNNAYLALGSAVKNATDQIADLLQQQEQEREAREAQQQEEEQEQDIENQQRQLQEQLDQLQQQQQEPNEIVNNNNNQNVNTEVNNAEQEANWGFNYLNGQGVNQDYAKALDLFRKSAAQGNVAAQCNLGWMLLNGKGITPDYAQALYWFQKSAAGGNVESKNNIGWMYQNGEGVNQDYAQALDWYEKAASQGSVDADNNLGFMYLNGQGVTQDYAQAGDWFKKSAERGNSKGKVWGYYASGMAAKSGNDLDGAIEDFYQALKLEHGFPEANAQLNAALNAKASTLSAEAAQKAPRSFEELRHAKQVAFEQQQNEIHRNFLKQFPGTWQPDSPTASGMLRFWIADSGLLQGSGEFKLKVRNWSADATDIDRYSCKIDEVDVGLDKAAIAVNSGQVTVSIQGDCQDRHSHRDHYFSSSDNAVDTFFGLLFFPIGIPMNLLSISRTSSNCGSTLTFTSDGQLSFETSSNAIVQFKKVSDVTQQSGAKVSSLPKSKA